MTYRTYEEQQLRKGVLVPVMPHEVTRLREHAQQVRDNAALLGAKHRHAWQPNSEEEQRRQLVGWIGELALAKHLKVPYEFAVNYDKTRHDVAGFEVRSTEHFNGHLITYPDDKAAPFVLALVHRISFYKFDVVLAGWIDLADANTPEHWRTDMRAPGYFTPQAALHPMATLRHTKQTRGSNLWLGN